jgi:hypothetical protein
VQELGEDSICYVCDLNERPRLYFQRDIMPRIGWMGNFLANAPMNELDFLWRLWFSVVPLNKIFEEVFSYYIIFFGSLSI